MKTRALLATAALGLLCFPLSATAADFEPIDTRYDWTGFYIGGHAGYGDANVDGVFDRSEIDGEFPEEATFADDLNLDGFIGGGQVGFNWQHDAFLLGLEGDFSFTDFNDKVGDFGNNDIIKADIDFLASLRVRAGFAADRFLVYATGGVAYASGDFKLIDDRGATPGEGSVGENSGSVNIDSFGGVVGGGAEWAITDQISIRGEGLYYIFDDKTNTSDETADSDSGDFLSLEDVFVVRGGVNLLF